MYCLPTNAGTPNNIKCRYTIIITVEEEGGFSAFNNYVVSEPAFAAAVKPVSLIVPVAPQRPCCWEEEYRGGGVVIASTLYHITEKEIN